MTDRELLASWELDILCAKNIGSVTLSKEFILAIDDFINRQKAEIEELEAEIDKQYEQAKADILGNMADGGTSCHWCIDQHRAEAVKEFAEELKKDISWHRTEMYMNGLKGTPRTHEITYECVEEYIDNLVKEFTEDKRE